jgi:hypothetical protein
MLKLLSEIFTPDKRRREADQQAQAARRAQENAAAAEAQRARAEAQTREVAATRKQIANEDLAWGVAERGRIEAMLQAQSLFDSDEGIELLEAVENMTQALANFEASSHVKASLATLEETNDRLLELNGELSLRYGVLHPEGGNAPTWQRAATLWGRTADRVRAAASSPSTVFGGEWFCRALGDGLAKGRAKPVAKKA